MKSTATVDRTIDWGVHVPFARPRIGEAEKRAVLKVLAQSRLTEGPEVAAFEEDFRDYTEGGMAVAVSSCTAALHLAWLALDLPPGAKILCPALTHPATALAIQAAGLKPVFIDATVDGNIDVGLMTAKIDVDVAGLCVVHHLGKPANMSLIKDIALNHELVIVEDCALSLGSWINDRHVGLHGDIGCFSFYPAKHITCGEGGMVLTSNADLADRVRRLRAFGKPDFDRFGLNYRLSEIAAALGRAQLERLDCELEIRKHNAGRLLEALYPKALGWHYAVSYVCDSSLERDEVANRIKHQNIEISRYYDKPVPHRRHFGGRGVFPVAEKICANSVTLPVGSHVKDRHIDMMVEAICGSS